LADIYLPSAQIPALLELLKTTRQSDTPSSIRQFAAPFQAQLPASQLATQRLRINQYFSHNQVMPIYQALKADPTPFAQQTWQVMQTRSPLLMCVTLEQLRRSKKLSFADCLRMERTMVRHCFKYGEIVEGVRALVIDKDLQPQWRPAHLEEVDAELVQRFFKPVWPDYAHPLRELE
jgi:enoyl-CoA hydratase/carnithine racemase